MVKGLSSGLSTIPDDDEMMPVNKVNVMRSIKFRGTNFSCI